MEGTKMSTYSLTGLDAQQMQVVADALELYTRIRLGQLEQVVDPWRFATRGDRREQTPDRLDVATALVGSLKQALTGFSATASWGIAADEVPAEARIAVDIRDVIRNHLAWERTPQGGHSVDLRPPKQWGPLPLPAVSR